MSSEDQFATCHLQTSFKSPLRLPPHTLRTTGYNLPPAVAWPSPLRPQSPSPPHPTRLLTPVHVPHTRGLCTHCSHSWNALPKITHTAGSPNPTRDPSRPNDLHSPTLTAPLLPDTPAGGCHLAHVLSQHRRQCPACWQVPGHCRVLAGLSRTRARVGDEKKGHSPSNRKSGQRRDDGARQARGWVAESTR